MKVLLVGNYEGDGQRSMDRFAEMLLAGLRHAGVTVELIRPRRILGRLRHGTLNKWLGYLDKFVLFPFALRRRAAQYRTDGVVHILDQGNAMYVRCVRAQPHLLTCHDVIAIRAARGDFPGRRTGLTGRIFQGRILAGLRLARRIACVSEATRIALRPLLERDNATVIPNGIADFWKPLPKEEARRIVSETAGADPGGFLLHAGSDVWYKNRAGAVRIFLKLRALAPEPWKLVMTGPPLDRTSREEVRRAGLERDVVCLGWQPDETLRAFYSAARLLLFPSLEEGFGWPILEAQACGCPVVTTGKPPMSDVGGEAAIYLSPDMDEGEAAGIVAQALSRPREESAGLENARLYPAEKMVRSYMEAYWQCLRP